MPHGKLMRTEAIESWLLRAQGEKVRDIQARYDVDARRLYDVWEEKTHVVSREEAIEEFRRRFPQSSTLLLFEPHIRRHEVRPKAQLELAF